MQPLLTHLKPFKGTGRSPMRVRMAASVSQQHQLKPSQRHLGEWAALFG